jgi:hypothetical protein
VVIVLAGDEHCRLRVEHALFRREEFVAGEERLGAQTRVGKIHVAAREGRCVRIENRIGHDRFVQYSVG